MSDFNEQFITIENIVENHKEKAPKSKNFSVRVSNYYARRIEEDLHEKNISAIISKAIALYYYVKDAGLTLSDIDKISLDKHNKIK